MPAAEIEQFYSTHKALYEFLLSSKQPTFASEANNNFRRSLVLAIASTFEHEITGIIRKLPEVYAGNHPFIRGLIEQKAISRQYHTYFTWDAKNANQFFSLFGPEFSERAKAHVKTNEPLDQSVRDFLELGNTRNRLAHLDYVTFDIDKSPEDIIALYRSATAFIAFLHQWLLGEGPPTETADTAEVPVAP